MNYEIRKINSITSLKDAESQLWMHVNNYRQEQIYIWQIFAKIRDDKLWEESNYTSFIDYCSKVWGYKRSQAYNLANAGETVQFLLKASTESDTFTMPSSVEQAAALSRIPEPERLGAWIEHQAKGTPLPSKKITKKHEKNNLVSENFGDSGNSQAAEERECTSMETQLNPQPIHDRQRENNSIKGLDFSNNLANLRTSEISVNLDNIDELIALMLNSFTIQQICKSLIHHMTTADLSMVSGLLTHAKSE